MAKLIFLLDGNVIKEYKLDKERMTIGRRASNDIYIDNLAISGEHAILVTEDANTYVEDLNSTNGTLVNEKRVDKQALKHGDEIGLGKYKLKFLNDGAINVPPSNGFSDTVLVEPKTKSSANKKGDVTDSVEVFPVEASSNPDGLPVQAIETEQVDSVTAQAQQSGSDALDSAEASSDQLVQPEAVSRGPHLITLNGEDADIVLLLDRSMVKIGQPGEQVAVVTRRSDGYFITHVSGDQYPIINGEIIGAQAYVLSDHDEVEVMDIKMEFRLD